MLEREPEFIAPPVSDFKMMEASKVIVPEGVVSNKLDVQDVDGQERSGLEIIEAPKVIVPEGVMLNKPDVQEAGGQEDSGLDKDDGNQGAPNPVNEDSEYSFIELACFVVGASLFLIFLAISPIINSHLPNWVYRFASGYVIGAMGSLSLAIFKKMAKQIWQKGLGSIDDSPWGLLVMVIFYSVLFAFGLSSWYAGAIGVTGLPYAIGFAFASILIQYGVVSILKKEK